MIIEKFTVSIQTTISLAIVAILVSIISIGFFHSIYGTSAFFLFLAITSLVTELYIIYKLGQNVIRNSERIVLYSNGLSFLVDKEVVFINWNEIKNMARDVDFDKSQPTSTLFIQISDGRIYGISLDGMNKSANYIYKQISSLYEPQK